MGSSALTFTNKTYTAAEWAAANPVLADGELGYAKDAQILKIGDGVTAWNDLEGVKISINDVPLGAVIGLHKAICYPACETFQASYHRNGIFNAEYGKGSLVGTPSNSPTVLNDLLDVSNGLTNPQHVEYDGVGNANTAIQKGCVRMRWKAGWIGFPDVASFEFFSIYGPDNKNRIRIIIDETGLFFLTMWDKDGVQLFTQALGELYCSGGQVYELEVNWNLTDGETRVFLDGSQIGPTIGVTGERDNNITKVCVGAASPFNSDFFVDEIKIFDAVVHTETYSSGNYDDTILALPEQFAEKYILCNVGGVVENEDSPFYGLQIPQMTSPFSVDVAVAWKILE